MLASRPNEERTVRGRASRLIRQRLTPHRAVVAAALGFWLASCDQQPSGNDTPIGSIEVIPATLTLTSGETRSVSARVLDPAGAPLGGLPIFWSTANPAVATVSQAGVVTAVGPGSTQIAASRGGKSGVLPVTVSGPTIGLVRVTPATQDILVGGTTTLTATALDPSGKPVTGRPVSWSSGTPTIATVNAAGEVTGVAEGSAAITATVGGVSGIAVVTVRLVPVASVSVTPATTSVFIGETLQLTAVIADAAGKPLTGRTTLWSSSAPSVASVSSTGVVTAGLLPGQATITATSEGKSGTSRVTVSLVPVNRVEIVPGSATISVGRTALLSAQPQDSAGGRLNGRKVTWVSAQPSIATVDDVGIVTAVAVGEARVTATSEGISQNATVTVTPTPVASISVSPATATLRAGATQRFAPTLLDAQGNELTGRVVNWISGAPTVASVDQTGLVTALGAGTALIIATSEGQRAEVTLTVTAVSVASVTVSPPTVSLMIGGSAQLSAAILDNAGDPVAGMLPTWTTSASAVATVSGTGLVTAISSGNATITATSGGKSGSAALVVSPVAVQSMTVAPKTGTLIAGGTLPLGVSLLDAAGKPLATTGRVILYSSSAPSVATVNATGMVTAVGPGSAAILVRCENASAGAVITVTAPPVASVSVAPGSLSLTAGTTGQLTATPRDASGAPIVGQSVTWSSANSAVATVSASGLVSAVAAGSAQITATSGGISGSVSVTVTTAGPGPIASITVTPLPGTIHVGSAYARQVTAQAFDANQIAVPAQFTWSSSSPQHLTVTPAAGGSAAATLTAAVAPATGLVVTVTANGVSGVSGTLTISSDLVPIATVDVAPTSGTLSPTQTQQLTVTPRDSAGNAIGTAAGDPLAGRTPTWSTGNASVATVNATGLVTAVAAGTASIDASFGGPGKGTFALTVVLPVSTTTVSITSGAPSMIEGDVATFTARVVDGAGNPVPNAPITWALSNRKASLSSSSGSSTHVTAEDSGAVVISATSGTQQATSTVTISLVPVDTIVSQPASRTPTVLLVGLLNRSSKEEFRVEAGNKRLEGRAFTVVSSDVNIVTVAPVGQAITDKNGRGEFEVALASPSVRGTSATVTVTVDGKSTVWRIIIL